MPHSFVALLRSGVFAFVVLASFILIGLCGHVTQTTMGLPLPFTGLGIAASVLAILTLPTMFIIDNQRRNAFSSMIIAEIVWLGILLVLFLATAGSATGMSALTQGLCFLSESELNGDVPFDFDSPSICGEYKVIQAFAYLTWLALFIYVTVLTAFSIKLVNRGYNRVWYQSVRETDFNLPPANIAPMAMPTQQYVPPV